MGLWTDIVGSVRGYIRLGLTGVRLKNSSGALAVRNAGDSADASVTCAGVTVTGGLIKADYSSDIASGATVDLGTATGNSVTVTHSSGTTAITSLGGASLQAGTEIETIFSISGGTLTITHHATNLYLAGGANITLANGDTIRWKKMHDSNAEWKMVGGVRASGVAWGVAAATNTGSTTFLGADVTLNNTGTYFNGPNTGSIGANGEVWLITATACCLSTASLSNFCVRISDGASVYADTETTSHAANLATNLSISVVVTLTAAATFTLQCKDAFTTSGKLLKTGPNSALAGRATCITAVRLS